MTAKKIVTISKLFKPLNHDLSVRMFEKKSFLNLQIARMRQPNKRLSLNMKLKKKEVPKRLKRLSPLRKKLSQEWRNIKKKKTLLTHVLSSWSDLLLTFVGAWKTARGFFVNIKFLISKTLSDWSIKTVISKFRAKKLLACFKISLWNKLLLINLESYSLRMVNLMLQLFQLSHHLSLDSM